MIAIYWLYVTKLLPVAHYTIIICEKHGEAFRDDWLQNDGALPQQLLPRLRACTRAQAEIVRDALISHFI